MVSDGPGRKGARWARIRRETLARHAYLCSPCFLCGKTINYRLGLTHPRHTAAPTVHHIVSLDDGGRPLDPANLAPAHYGCNCRDGQRQHTLATRQATASRQW
jgi:5-methylcytosine-specific restriction endonuclease McrA